MLSLQTVKNRQNFIAAALAAHAAMWFANHCAASVNSAEYQASVENALAEAEAAFDAPTSAEIDDIFALLDTTAVSDACAECNAIEDIQFEALGELSTLRAEAEATIREHLQLGGLLTMPELTVARLVRSRASMAMRDFPA